MIEIWVVVVAAIGGVVTGVVTGVFGYRRLRSERQFDVDTELRDQRLEHYAGAWKVLAPLSKYQSEQIDREKLKNLEKSLSDWYYQDGGLFLTKGSQRACVACLSVLRRTSDSDAQWSDDQLLRDEIRELLFDIASGFRTHLTLDLGSRFEPRLRDHHYITQRKEADERIQEAKVALQTGGGRRTRHGPGTENVHRAE